MRGHASIPARVAGALVPIVLASLLVLVRGVLDRADLALILVLAVVAIAASGDRVAAAICAASVAASFDFFLTKPYGSLRMDSATDLENAALLLLIGLAVGQIAIVGRHRQRQGSQAQADLARLELVAARIAADASIPPLVELVERQIADTLSLDSCRFKVQRPELPELRADGSVGSSRRILVDDHFALPQEGAALAVVGAGGIVGWMRLTPGRAVGVSLASRKAAVALAQQLGVVLTRPVTE